MGNKGWSHIGLTTLDMDRTQDFYVNVLGFEVVRSDIIEVEQGGRIRHVFFDTGGGQLVAFMGPEEIPGLGEYDPGINRGLGLPDGLYHFAFEAGSVRELEEKRRELIERGVKVTPIVDHEWAKSIYFKDPNGLMLEYCAYARELGEEDRVPRVREHLDMRKPSPLVDFRDE